MPRRISEERRRRIIQDLRDGLLLRQIAKDHGVSMSTVWNIDQERKADDKLLAEQMKNAEGDD